MVCRTQGGRGYNGVRCVHGYVEDVHRPCPSRSSRVSSLLLLLALTRPVMNPAKTQGRPGNPAVPKKKPGPHRCSPHARRSHCSSPPRDPPWGPITHVSKAKLMHAVGSLRGSSSTSARQPPPQAPDEHLDGQRCNWLGYSSPVIVLYLTALRRCSTADPLETCPCSWLTS